MISPAETKSPAHRITALAGGIGAAKLLAGLVQVADPALITVIVNTGDDIRLHGLHISPDIDTVTYTLAGIVNQERGWGLRGDTFLFRDALARFDGEQWFNLGDRDLATHVFRTELLGTGATLTEVTDRIRKALGVLSRILPMTDSYVPTHVLTPEGAMHLQEFLVRRRAEPRVDSVEYVGICDSYPSAGVVNAIHAAGIVLICPSNPFISIGPILAVPGIREALVETPAPVVSISPIIGGRAVKGPAAAMLRDLGHEVSAAGVAALYRDFADLFVLDQADRNLAARVESMGFEVLVADTMMLTLQDKSRVARAAVDLAMEWGRSHRRPGAATPAFGPDCRSEGPE